jgi:cytochrome oxidase Cu insertion factor (SCO1/SenC/PrrC family)
MNPQIQKRLIRIFILSLIVLCIGGGIVFYQSHAPQNAIALNKRDHDAVGIPVQGIDLGGSYTLVNQNGETVTDQTYANVYKFIYFGFTYCPAICPTELQKITRVMNALPPETAAKIQPLFITIDPERDTPDVMREYVSLFDERLVGLTGTPEQIDVVKKAYKIYARKVHEPDMSDYTMDHSSYLYLMSPDDKLIGLYRIEDKVNFVTNDIRAKLSP